MCFKYFCIEANLFFYFMFHKKKNLKSHFYYCRGGCIQCAKYSMKEKLFPQCLFFMNAYNGKKDIVVKYIWKDFIRLNMFRALIYN